jgi:hypothetical protein
MGRFRNRVNIPFYWQFTKNTILQTIPILVKRPLGPEKRVLTKKAKICSKQKKPLIQWVLLCCRGGGITGRDPFMVVIKEEDQSFASHIFCRGQLLRSKLRF